MSDLTEALNRILNWLHINHWSRFKEIENSAYLLQPGLSRDEINFTIGDSNLELPEEIYELYQWRNGALIAEWDYVDLFDINHNFAGFGPWGFMPFQSLFTFYMQRQNSYARTKPAILKRISAFPCISDWLSPSALQIFCCREGCMTGYVYKDNNYESFPVVCIDYKGGSDTVLGLYASLTDMMLTIAESYETAYYIREDGYLEKDTTKVLAIWQKYNSQKLVEGVLAKIKLLEPTLPQLEMGGDLLKEVADTLKFSHDERLIAPLVRVLRRQPTNTDDDKNLDYLRQMSSLYLGWLGDRNTIVQLIPALKDEYWMTRYWAAITLGQLPDLQAVPHLNELLEDNQELVRQAAQESLNKITNPNLETNPLYNHPGMESFSAAAALYGMNLSDMLNPDIETLIEKLDIDNRADEDNN
jgi:HEAT repeats